MAVWSTLNNDVLFGGILRLLYILCEQVFHPLAVDPTIVEVEAGAQELVSEPDARDGAQETLVEVIGHAPSILHLQHNDVVIENRQCPKS